MGRRTNRSEFSGSFAILGTLMTSPDALTPPSRSSRRRWLVAMSGLVASIVAGRLVSKGRAVDAAGPWDASGRDEGNFAAIYGDPARRAEFRHFLENVFHLYPVAEFGALIADCVARDPRDPAVFRQLEARLSEVTPFLGAVRYSLPALGKQKAEMAAQTKQLLGERRGFEGYLELGSHGRYYDAIAPELDVRGPIFTSAPRLPTRSPEDIVDRGALSPLGTALPWTDYAPLPFGSSGIPEGSLDLITVYIGFHHAALDRRQPLLRSLHRLLSKDGVLVVRDHDVVSPELRHLVGLAHDVFNVGTNETFRTNDEERRNFYSLAELEGMLAEAGFVAGPERLLQTGDPTKNTLLRFSKA